MHGIGFLGVAMCGGAHVWERGRPGGRPGTDSSGHAVRGTAVPAVHFGYPRRLPPPFRPTVGSLVSTGRNAFNSIKNWLDDAYEYIMSI